MDKHIIHKDRGETFNCHFKIDGANIKDTIVRLCLEFDNNKNLFFNGVLKENGDCVVEIPKLKEVNEKEGKLTIEAIADSVYFKLYEADVEFKKSIEVSMVETPVSNESVSQTTKVQLGISQEIKKPIKNRAKKILEEATKAKATKVQSPNEWQPLRTPEPAKTEQNIKPEPETEPEDSKFISLREYLNKK